jgi:hypothetical protein
MAEAAERCRYSYVYFATHYKEWRIPFTRISRKVLFMERDIDNFIEKCRVIV